MNISIYMDSLATYEALFSNTTKSWLISKTDVAQNVRNTQLDLSEYLVT